MPHGCSRAHIARTLAAICLLAASNAFAEVIYVNANAVGANTGTSWQDAFTSLAFALSAVDSPDDQVWVAAGTYVPPLSGAATTASFHLPNAVTLLGGFAGGEPTADLRNPAQNITVLSGDRNNDDGPGFTNRDDNVWHVLNAQSISGQVIIDGFTIRGGYARSPSLPDYAGAALLIGGGEVHLRNCTFADNMAVETDSTPGRSLGGAISADDGDLYISHCRFENNYASFGGAIAVQGTSEFSCTDSVFSGNFSESNSVFAAGAVLTDAVLNVDPDPILFARCTFENNSGGVGAVSVYTHGDLAYVDCVFRGNTGGGAGGALFTGVADHTLAVNCVFDGNSCGPGFGSGGFAAWFHDAAIQLRVVNCTFVRNVATGGSLGAVLASGGGDEVVANCIFSDNVNTQALDPLGPLEARYSCIQGGYAGTTVNVFDADPQFANLAAGDLRLQANSPCIDAGEVAALPPDAWDRDADGDTTEPHPADLAGTIRRANMLTVPDTGAGAAPLPDLGAYEHRTTGDFDGDGAVTTNDLALLVDCLAGPWADDGFHTSPIPAACDLVAFHTADMNADNAVDLRDFAIWQTAGAL